MPKSPWRTRREIICLESQGAWIFQPYYGYKMYRLMCLMFAIFDASGYLIGFSLEIKVLGLIEDLGMLSVFSSRVRLKPITRSHKDSQTCYPP